ncbi:MAG: hypothetical protein D6799_06050 [Bacteroidetes bacterium]|jgi:hypothetical protein|nr:MAG: hypothetical protein D6799_06050 [Bacteroidota bacterium]
MKENNYLSAKIKIMKTVKMLVVSGVIATMSAYAQDGGKQQPKQEEKKGKEAPKQEVTIKQKSSSVKNESHSAATKEAKPAEPAKHEEKKAHSPKQ